MIRGCWTACTAMYARWKCASLVILGCGYRGNINSRRTVPCRIFYHKLVFSRKWERHTLASWFQLELEKTANRRYCAYTYNTIIKNRHRTRWRCASYLLPRSCYSSSGNTFEMFCVIIKVTLQKVEVRFTLVTWTGKIVCLRFHEVGEWPRFIKLRIHASLLVLE